MNIGWASWTGVWAGVVVVLMVAGTILFVKREYLAVVVFFTVAILATLFAGVSLLVK